MKKLVAVSTLIALFALTLGVTYAAFTDKGKYQGSTFSVGSADLKILNDVTLGLDPLNLVEVKEGPVFENISPNWSQNYLMKIYNNATTNLALTTNANYETANDPADLRSIIFVEPFEWNDANGDGIVDTGEEGTSLGRKTIVKWKTEGYNLGTLNRGEVKSLILRFSTDSVSETKQGASGMIDFEFNATGM